MFDSRSDVPSPKRNAMRLNHGRVACRNRSSGLLRFRRFLQLRQCVVKNFQVARFFRNQFRRAALTSCQAVPLVSPTPLTVWRSSPGFRAGAFFWPPRWRFFGRRDGVVLHEFALPQCHRSGRLRPRRETYTFGPRGTGKDISAQLWRLLRHPSHAKRQFQGQAGFLKLDSVPRFRRSRGVGAGSL